MAEQNDSGASTPAVPAPTPPPAFPAAAPLAPPLVGGAAAQSVPPVPVPPAYGAPQPPSGAPGAAPYGTRPQYQPQPQFPGPASPAAPPQSHPTYAATAGAPGAAPAPPAANAAPAYAAPPAPTAGAQGYPASASPAVPPYAQTTTRDGYPVQYSAPQPPAGGSGKTVAIIVGSVAGMLAIIALIIVSLLVANPASPEPVSAPAITHAPTPESTPDDVPSSGGSPVEDSTAGEEIGAALQAKIDEYKLSRDDGTLWQQIPDDDFNRTAVSAFLYLLTDMKSATIWGVDAATADEYSARMDELETKLLAQEPLGTDIRIVLENRTFEYDGDTGEGGYTDE